MKFVCIQKILVIKDIRRKRVNKQKSDIHGIKPKRGSEIKISLRKLSLNE